MIDMLLYILMGWTVFVGLIYMIYDGFQTDKFIYERERGLPDTAKLRVSQYNIIYIIIGGPMIWFMYLVEKLCYK